jgi:serine/threonine protein kinase
MRLLQDGQIIRDTYEVERPLGEGAFAEVYRVRHRFLGRQAMKVFKIVGMTIEETEEMLGEALLLSRIGHPNIVRVFDANTAETSLGICGFFTMEYVAGGSLENFWRSYGVRFVPVEDAVNVITQVCRGLAIAHQETPPMIHRDIKPQNILVGYEAEGLRVRLSDFGLAKNVNPLTLLASAQGTPSFKSPEVFLDRQSDSCAGDVWSVGATLYLLLTDTLPYSNEDHPDRFDFARFDQPLVPPSRLNMQVDDDLEALILKALAKDPDERYSNADELLTALAAWRPRKQEFAPTLTNKWHASKHALGVPPPGNESEARKMAKQALTLAKQSATLFEAADLMEEAFNRWPNLRADYETQIQLWRRGISM